MVNGLWNHWFGLTGLFSRSSSNLRFEGSPVSSVGNGELISVEYYNNSSRDKKSINSRSNLAASLYPSMLIL